MKKKLASVFYMDTKKTKLGDHKLIKVIEKPNFFSQNPDRIYSLKSPKDVILVDYWNILSIEAVQNGVGVIDLFFKKVEKEKQTGELLAKNKSRAEKRREKFNLDGFNFVKGLYGSSLGNDDVEELLQTGLVVGALNDGNNPNSSNGQGENQENSENSNQNDENFNSVDNSGENSVDNSEGENDNRETALLSDNTRANAEQTPNDAEQTQENGGENDANAEQMSNNAEQTQNIGYQPGFGGGGGGGGTTQPQPAGAGQSSNTIASVGSPTVLAPANYSQHNTTTITFSGNASSTNIISTDFSDATTTADTRENWLLVLDNFIQGTTTINFYASNQEQTATSTATTTEIFVDSTAPDISLTVDECQNSISQSGCLLATTTAMINASWSSSSTDLSHYILNKNGTSTTTTATSTQITISGNQNYTLGVSAVDIYGNVSSEETKVIQTHNAPVVINEVAWAGTHSSSADEWIELYNNTDKDINLSNWLLYAEDNTPNIPLSGTILANGYYLLERTDDDTVSDITANLIYGNDGSDWALNNNNGEHLILEMQDPNATSTTKIDEINKANKWNFKGFASPRYYAMERFSSEEPGTDWNNWESNTGHYVKNGKNAGGGIIYGTPKAKNNFSYRIAKGNSISSNKTLTKAKSPYLITEDFTVKNGATLTAESGVVVKFHSRNTPTLKIEGTLSVNGTTGDQVIFTSFTDDEFGGDTNGDGICDPGNASSTSACPTVGGWRQILFESTSQNSVLENTIVRYGGYYTTGHLPKYKGMVTVDNADITISNSVFEYSKSKSLQLLSTTAGTTVSNNIFRHNNYEHPTQADYPYGLFVQLGSPTVSNNLFENNKYGAYFDSTKSVVSSNEFKDNTSYAISTLNGGVFEGNHGNDNGWDGILMDGVLTVANETANLKQNIFPYVINGNTTVVASSTLIVDPNVVVKFNDKKLDVYGRLEIDGGVLFTSINDDSDGTNVKNDLEPVPILASNISGTYMKPGATSVIKNTEFRYMKCGVGYDNAPPIYLENVIFKNNKTAICNDTNSTTASSTVSNITFEGNNATSTNPLP